MSYNFTNREKYIGEVPTTIASKTFKLRQFETNLTGNWH